jgi:hypothetical protein
LGRPAPGRVARASSIAIGALAMSGQRHRSAGEVFRAPALLAAASVGGLVSALIGDGLWDAVSWLLLGLPVAVATICFCRRPDERGRYVP